MKKKLFILLILGFPVKHVCSQSNENTPKNYPGIYTALVFDNISTSVGIEYERYLLVRSKFAWAARAGYLFKYKWGNANIISGADDNVTSSNWQFWSGGYWYTSTHEHMEGFFINGSLGVTYTQSEERIMLSPPAYTIIKGDGLSPAIEAGLGFQFIVKPGLAIRLGGFGAVYFPANENKSFSPKNTLSLRASVGF
jgi:hypothetical protein